jgi:sugar O-acyltransferase (sialic acid O-acetyltransferase NeuD family)
MSRPIVIFGNGQIAEVFHYYVTHEAGRNVAAFTVDRSYLKEDTQLGVPVVDFETVDRHFPPSQFDMLIAISFREVNKARQRKVAEAVAKGYRLSYHISPKAVVWSGFQPRPNTFIMENNVIQPYVKIGQNVILWSGNHIGHHTEISDNCFIASHVVVSGNVKVGENSFIGVNATLRDNIVIGKFNVIGAAALILANTPDEAVYLGQASTLAKVPSSRLRRI